MTLEILKRYLVLVRNRYTFSGRRADGIPYRIRENPKNGRALVGSVLEVPCDCQIHMGTDEEVALHLCEKHTGTGKVMEILNLPREELEELSPVPA